MTIRAITLIATDPSGSAAALHRVLGWEIGADHGSFASLTPPAGPPLWLNEPYDGLEPSSGVILHLASEDVDQEFERAVARGARAVREPQDMDFGERSASVTLDELPGVTFDLSAPLES